MKLLVAVVLIASACGSKSPSATTMPSGPSGPSGEAGSAAVVLPDVPFGQLDQDQRAEFMKQKVVPRMKPLFQNHDPKRFAEFGCQTCHGAQAKDGHFDMPNPKLPRLNFGDMSKFKKEDLEWMNKAIEPTMAKILNKPLYSKENPKGFGCLACHTPEGS
ncbi:MAG TPA: hypothetical protein VHN14_09635 [Kofleriaceae bacterium]|jgi:hypothetical protein|nr:hypothetical protein [Kofleriaceae bacterium]